MLLIKKIPIIRDAAIERCGPGPIDLETISDIVSNYGVIDHIEYVGYNCTPENPILGSFEKYRRRPALYADEETCVRIKYANHLSLEMRRLVVTKELCHSFDEDKGEYTVTDASLGSLVDAFALSSSTGNFVSVSGMPTEILAEAAAIELLCPLNQRKEILKNGGLDLDALVLKFGLPREHLELAFHEKYMTMIETVIS